MGQLLVSLLLVFGAYADDPEPTVATPVEIASCRLLGDLPENLTIPLQIQIFQSIDEQGNSFDSGMLVFETRMRVANLPDPISIKSIYESTVRVAMNEADAVADVYGLYNDDANAINGLEADAEVSAVLGEELYLCQPTGYLNAQLKVLSASKPAPNL